MEAAARAAAVSAAISLPGEVVLIITAPRGVSISSTLSQHA